jgi:hypothetical protein
VSSEGRTAPVARPRNGRAPAPTPTTVLVEARAPGRQHRACGYSAWWRFSPYLPVLVGVYAAIPSMLITAGLAGPGPVSTPPDTAVASRAGWWVMLWA